MARSIWKLLSRVSYSVLACFKTLNDDYKSNLKPLEMGWKSALANIDFFSKLLSSIWSFGNLSKRDSAKDLMVAESKARQTEAAKQAF
jgi:hypothetical protein